MDQLNNNNNHINADHATSITPTAATAATKQMQNLNEAMAHPLQDVPLTLHENMPEMHSEQQQQQQQQGKRNWVKFDDDANEMSDENNPNGDNNNKSYDQADSSIAATMSIANKLSTKAAATSPGLLPPPPPQASTRPRTPNESAAGKLSISPTSPLQREPVTISPLDRTSPIPLQRSTTGTVAAAAATATPDVAPAVLTTESTHVNLNASGKAQQQQQQQQQQQSNLPQKQQQKTKTSAIAGSDNNSNQRQHQQPLQSHHTQLPLTQHHNNGSSGSGIGVGVGVGGSGSNINNGTTTPMQTATNNAMHHKSHHNQQQHQHQHQHHHTNATTASPVEVATSSMPPTSTGPPAMRTIELSTGRIREGFANGDVIVTLLPANTKWPWITPAIFRPELVPEELMAQGLTLTVEEYVQAMETLVNDFRFTVYNICYKRILVCWIFFAFAVLLTLLFSGLQGVALFSLGVGWLFLNAAAIFLCMWVKLRLARGLEKCLARVNRQLMKHKILLILDDRGRISCHKVNLCFLYFDATQCVNFLNEFLEQTEQNGGEDIKAGWESKLDIDLNDIVIQGNTPVRVSRKQEWGMQMFLRYSSRWGMEALRGLVDISPMEPGRHCGQFQCPCQYIKQHLQYKPRGKLKSLDCIYWVLAAERYEY